MHRKILIGLLLGASLGLVANTLAPGAAWLDALVRYGSEPAGRLFVRLLLMLVVPIVFSALVTGVGDLELSELGRLGAKTLVYTVAVSAVAVAIGVGLVNLFEPGRGVAIEHAVGVPAVNAAPARAQLSAPDFLVALVPENPLRAAADGDMLAFIVFSLVFGVALAQTRTPGARRLRKVIEGIFDVMMRVIQGVLRLAPIGVGALLFTMTARTGFALVAHLAAYVGVVLLGLGLHMLVVYSFSVRVLGGVPVLRFFRDARLAMLTAFSTASSSATLPTALEVADSMGLPRQISRFVLTAGATMNQNGTALFEGVTVLFLAQAYGVSLGALEQVMVMGVCILAGIGTAGVPAGSLPVIAAMLGMIGVPAEGLGLVLGVDRLLDMCRTVVNVTGDLAAAVVVSRGTRSPAHAPGEP